MKKALALILCLALLSLAACTSANPSSAGTASPSASPSQSPSASPSEPQAPLEPYEILWYQYGNGMTPDHPAVMARLNEMTADINTTVNVVNFSWGEYNDKMATIISASEKFDMCFMNAVNYSRYASMGAFLDLTDIYEESFPQFSKVLDTRLAKGALIGGKLYGLPCHKEIFSRFGFDINLTLAEQAGIDVDALGTLSTFSDLDATLREIKEKLPDVTPLFMKRAAGLRADWDVISGTIGAVYFNDPTCTVFNEFASPEMLEIWRQFHIWYNDGIINNDAATVTEDTIWNTGMAFSRTGSLGPIPVWNTGGFSAQRVTVGKNFVNTGAATNAVLAFSQTSQNPERVMMWFDRFATDSEMYNTMCLGIEGTHYEITDKATTPWRWDYPAGINGDNVTYKSGGAWTLGGDWFMSYLSPSEDDNRNDVVLSGNDAAILSPLAGFTFDSSAVQNEISACQTVIDEYRGGLNTGMLDPDVYAEEFIKKLNDNGAEKIVAEKQRQVDEWKASKGG